MYLAKRPSTSTTQSCVPNASDQVPALHKAVFQMQHFTGFFLSFNPLSRYKVEVRPFVISYLSVSH
jgi:hypothetical protein